MTWGIITDHSEDYIGKLLEEVLKQMEFGDKLIIVDNLSDDETVPKIVETISYGFIDEEKITFYINCKPKTPRENKEMIKKILIKNNDNNKFELIQRKKINRNYLKQKRGEKE